MGKFTFDSALKELGNWFERQKRVLPWRDEPTLYRVWVSEIMLQQTQVATVIPYFEKFLARFPTVQALAEAPSDDVMLHWAGLGYYSRARNLHRAAQEIVARGDFPRDREGWLGVPGVGQYTAGAILSIALGKPEAILDGNVERVLSRVRRVSRAKGDVPYKERLWRLSWLFVERANELGISPSVLNQGLMELGATTCTPRKPKCLICPLREICRAHQMSEEEAYPPKKKRKEWLQVREEVDCLFDDRGRMLLVRRAPGEWRAGLWDFAAGGSSLKPRGAKKVGQVESKLVVTRHKITRVANIWKLSGDKSSTSFKSWGAAENGSQETRWVSVASPDVAVGSALKKTLKQIRETYPEALE